MTTYRYRRPAIYLHWAVAVLTLFQIGLGLAADRVDRPLADDLLAQHVRVGLLILALMILRLSWRVISPPPPMPKAVPRWRRRGAAWVYAIFYLLLMGLPISGYILWAWIAPTLNWWGAGRVPILFAGGDDEWLRSVMGYGHQFGSYGLMALILIHILAALHHHFIARDMRIDTRIGFWRSRQDY